MRAFMHSVERRTKQPFFAMIILGGIVAQPLAYANDDHGDNCASGTVITADGPAIDGTLTAGDADYFLVNAPTEGRITAFTTGNTDTVGRLFNADGFTRGSDDSSGPLPNNFLISEFESAGNYCIQVRGKASDTQGSYAIQVNGDFGNDDHGSSCDTTSTTVANPSITTFNGVLSDYGDADYFIIQSSTRGRISVWTTGNTDTFGRLFNADGFTRGSDDSSGPLPNNFRISEFEDAGNYCVQVTGGAPNITGSYTLVIEADLGNDDHGSTCSTGTVVENQSVPGELTVYDDADYFIIQLLTEGTLTVSTTGNTDTVGRLYNADGFTRGSDDSSGPLPDNFLISRSLSAGNYCLEVGGKQASTQGSYVVNVEGDVPFATELIFRDGFEAQ